MTFLFALVLAMLIPMTFLTQRGRAAMGGGDRVGALELVALTALMLIQSGLILGLIVTSWRQGDTNWTPILIGGGGALTACVGARSLMGVYSASRQAKPTPNWMAAWVTALISGLYLAGAGIDHYLFWKDAADVGIAADVVYKQADVDCDYPYVLLRKRGDEVEYRCPHNLFLGYPIGQPFVPWPTYSTGVSNRMMAVQQELYEQARRLEHAEKNATP